MRPRVEPTIEDDWVKPLISAGMLAYLAAVAMLAWRGHGAMIEPVAGFQPDLGWTIHVTNAARIGALLESGNPLIAFLYERLELFSILFVAFGVAVGLAGALPASRRTQADPIVLMAMTVASILAYAGHCAGPFFFGSLFAAGALSADIGATPAFWFRRNGDGGGPVRLDRRAARSRSRGAGPEASRGSSRPAPLTRSHQAAAWRAAAGFTACGEILDQRAGDGAGREAMRPDLGDWRHLGGRAGQEALVEAGELVRHDPPLDHLDAARLGEADHRLARDAVEEAVGDAACGSCRPS